MRVQESRGGRLQGETLAALITDAAVLARVAAKWRRPMFGSDWCDQVGDWCVEHYRKYQEPPAGGIEHYYAQWAEQQRPGSPVVEQVGQFLAALSRDHERNGHSPSVQQRLDRAAECFDRAALDRMFRDGSAALEAGRLEEARRVAVFAPSGLSATSCSDPLSDPDEVRAVFTEDPKDVVEFTGALGRFFAGHLHPASFVSFIAPNKSYKSYWCMEVAYQAMLQRKRTMYFIVGDLTKRQAMRRLIVRSARHPIWSPAPGGRWPCTVRWPLRMESEKGAGLTLSRVTEYEEEVFEEALAQEDAVEAMRRVQRRHVRSDEPYLKLQCLPAGSVTVNDLRAELDQQASQGFTADVVVVDYADNLGPLDRRADRRDQVNDTWRALSALRQERHCLLVTATQADSESFRKGLLDRHNFSEDRRKLDHVTAMVGINITPEEKERGVCRLNWVNIREGGHSHLHVVHVAHCLDLCNPAVLSCF